MCQKIKTLLTRSGTWIDTNFIKIHIVVLAGCIGYAMYNACTSTYQYWICWERVALIVYGIFNFSLLWTGMSEKKSWTIAFERNSRILWLVPLFGVVIYSFPKAYQAINNRETLTHLFFVLIMTTAFLMIDLLVRNEASRGRTRTDLSHEIRQKIGLIHDNFEKNVYFSDWPSVIAFFVLFLTLEIRTKKVAESNPMHENFVGGAIAFQLIASVVIFLFILKGFNKQNFAARHSSTNPNTGSSE